MRTVDRLIIKIKRADTPFYAALKRLAKGLLTVQAPIPNFALPLFAAASQWNALVHRTQQRFVVALYRYPVFRSRCEAIGEALEMEHIPAVSGPVKIWIGNNVRLSGQIAISSGRVFDEPRFVLGDRAFIGHRVNFAVAKEIVVEEDVLIAAECIISDYSGHPVNPEKRLAGVQVEPEDIRPVRICRNAWLGRRAIVLPGVTIGEGAVVGAGTVVTKDVPPFTICVGNPGRNIERKVAAASNA